ncbi:unnamed protein product [Cylicocyclus nassatus]|uniref:CCHC-type domain-containing protein n=1 Tax=Cylicocyclus nassatus TaxID=53992 RepID=A0AA36H2X0_CYLNA|nr:unnamed protein product [Cylicocyclus nassatus]
MSNSSANIRRQIGFFKKQLQKFCSEATDSLREYGISPTAPRLEVLDDDAIETFRLELTTIRSNLLKNYAKITKLDEEWNTLQQANPEEQQVLAKYIKKYGDYHDSIADAVKQLEVLDVLLNSIDQEFARRRLPASSISSETHTPDEDQLWNRGTLHTSTIHQISDPSLLNFVDASILSKLELPTFDGNLLDYPEFQSRFATLVGNKLQLDDTTKFSLLKSCLRGKALHVIQGLSITPANYKVAMDILRTHFDDKVTLKHILYTKLASLPACDLEGKNLLSLYNQMYSLVRQFCNGTDDSSEKALGALLLNKLPPHVRSQIYDRTQHDHNVSPTELLHLLTNIVRKESTLSEMNFYSKQQHPSFHQGAYVANKQSQSTRLKPTGTRHPQNCSFCNSSNHSSLNCPKYATPRQRSEEARKRRLCYNCLSPHHNTRDCPSKFRCRICARKHHTSLCTSSRSQSPSRPTQPTSRQDTHRGRKEYTRHSIPRPEIQHGKPYSPNTSPSRRHNRTVHFDLAHSAIIDNQPSSETEQSVPTISSEDTLTNVTFMSNETSNRPIPLMCAEVKLFNPDDSSHHVTVTAFLDSGSSISYITDELATILDLPDVTTETVTVSTFGERTPRRMKCSVYRVEIETEWCQMFDGEIYSLRGWRCSTNCTRQRLIRHRLLNTTIGDIILNKALDTRYNNCSLVAVENNDMANPAHHNDLCEMVSRFWKLESIGILDNPNQCEDTECLDYFNNTIYYDRKEKRYVVSLPFKEDPANVPDNYSLAYSRLRSQLKQLQQNPSYLKMYHAVIQDQLRRNIIEYVPNDELYRPCHYLPHHGVVKRDDKGLKIRCVYDGSVKMKGHLSLNEALYRGPVLLPDLVDIETEKRQRSIVVAGLKESELDKPLLERRAELEKGVADILETLNIDCRPTEIFRMRKADVNRLLLVKLAFPFRVHWKQALTNAHLLRHSAFSNIFIRRSMTAAERLRSTN